MNKHSHLCITIVILWLAVSLAGCGAAATPTPEIPKEGRWETFEFTSEALAGNLAGDPATRTIHVYLPPSYDTGSNRYPVVYGLHGYLESPPELRVLGSQLNSLIANGEAREMILVLPDGNNKFGGSHYLNSPTIGDYEGYIARELVAYIDANYRTTVSRDTRGVAGCSMGGNGAMHLAFRYPDIFGAGASVSDGYAYGEYPQWEEARAAYSSAPQPKNLDDIPRLPWYIRVQFANAAAAASNPDNPPLYLDMPFEIVDGETRTVPEVLQKISDVDAYSDLQDYLDQPVRLRGLAIYHGALDYVPVSMARSFSEALTESGIEHQYAEVEDGHHCGRNWDYSPLLKFMSETLAQ